MADMIAAQTQIPVARILKPRDADLRQGIFQTAFGHSKKGPQQSQPPNITVCNHAPATDSSRALQKPEKYSLSLIIPMMAKAEGLNILLHSPTPEDTVTRLPGLCLTVFHSVH